jgi:hypothetical protein
MSTTKNTKTKSKTAGTKPVAAKTKTGKQGKIAGATSFQNIPLSLLVSKLTPNSSVMVGRNMCKILGITGTSGTASQLLAVIKAEHPPIVVPAAPAAPVTTPATSAPAEPVAA